MDQIPIKFLESVVQNISFGFPEISNSATEKIFSVLILVYFVNRLFTCLGRIIESEGMLEFYISFVEGIIYVFIFCYLTNSTWYFLPWIYILWFLGNHLVLYYLSSNTIIYVRFRTKQWSWSFRSWRQRLVT